MIRTLILLLLITPACAGPAQKPDRESRFAQERREMVERQLAARDITSGRVLKAMREVPRHRFVPEGWRDAAYRDSPLPIGQGQTISQPYIVALMSQALEAEKGDKVLEIGTGSGYQAAVLAEMGVEVYTIEIIPELAEGARAVLKELGYENVHVRTGDGYAGWPEEAPFDGVIVTAAPEEVPPPLLAQLAPGGRLIIPVGPTASSQSLYLYRKTKDGKEIKKINLGPVRFVPFRRNSP